METEEASEDRARVTTGARSLKSLGTALRSVSGLDSGCEILPGECLGQANGGTMGASLFKLIWGGRWNPSARGLAP